MTREDVEKRVHNALRGSTIGGDVVAVYAVPVPPAYGDGAYPSYPYVPPMVEWTSPDVTRMIAELRADIEALRAEVRKVRKLEKRILRLLGDIQAPSKDGKTVVE